MKSILLIGLGKFGRLVARELYDLGHEVMAVDSDEDRVNDILPYVTNAQIGDSTNEEFLRSLGPDNYDACIVTIGNDFQSSLETTSLLKELGARLVVSRAETAIQQKFLTRNGADAVVYPEKQAAKWTAITYSSELVFDYVGLDEDYAIYEVAIPSSWIGQRVSDIDIRKKYNINILGTKKDGKLNAAISPDQVFEEGYNLLVIGDHKAIQKCFRIN